MNAVRLLLGYGCLFSLRACCLNCLDFDLWVS